MKIITISGLDGSGKSTQVKLLSEYFEARGLKVLYFHAVAFSLPNRFAAFLSELKSFFSVPSRFRKERPEDRKSVASAGWLSIQLRKFFLLIDLCRFRRFCKKMEKVFDIMLSDRYLYDSVINIQFLSQKESPLFTERFIPEPTAAVFLDVEPESIMKRERVPDQGLGYLKAKHKLFLAAKDRWKLRIVNGNAPKETVFEDIKRIIAEIQ